ncbi:DUF1566 domain-containing protein [Candidatus Electronema sp. PJ]|uniref:Lcl C-terminal domain-containing protein n=1 Tax=Candidatus Electronema sp. PJ TaxID=3401572 RepID=UPI003AA830F0
MKKTLLLLGLTAIVAVPSTGSAKMPLDIPPILASGCNQCNPCVDTNCTNPCTPCANGCCGATCKNDTTCAYCCEGGTCSADVCPTPQTEWGNDTGITVCPANTPALDEDCDFGRDKTVTEPNPSDGQAGFSFTKLDSSGNPTTGTAVCIKDNVTGLTWSSNLGPSTFAGLEEILQQNANLCGLTGWRMPTIKELVSIVSYHRINPAIDNNVFTDTENVSYRSSTPNAADGTQIWGVNFAYGYADNNLLTDSAYQVRLVRPLP